MLHQMPLTIAYFKIKKFLKTIGVNKDLVGNEEEPFYNN